MTSVEIGPQRGALRAVLPTGLPRRPGCYALVLRLDEPCTLVVGALGPWTFGTGLYAYCGSAQGTGGLRARVARHLQAAAGPHWHVDYLRAVGRVVAVWLWPGAPQTHECALADRLAQYPGARRHVHRFGSTDCRCPGHLIALPDSPADLCAAARAVQRAGA